MGVTYHGESHAIGGNENTAQEQSYLSPEWWFTHGSFIHRSQYGRNLYSGNSQ